MGIYASSRTATPSARAAVKGDDHARTRSAARRCRRPRPAAADGGHRRASVPRRVVRRSGTPNPPSPLRRRSSPRRFQRTAHRSGAGRGVRRTTTIATLAPRRRSCPPSLRHPREVVDASPSAATRPHPPLPHRSTHQADRAAYFALGPLGAPATQDTHRHAARPRPGRADQRTRTEVRLYRTPRRQDFHTDGANIIGLSACSARVGGREQARPATPFTTRSSVAGPICSTALRADVVGPRRQGVGRRAPPSPAGPPRHRRLPRVLHRLVRPRRAASRCPRLTEAQLGPRPASRPSPTTPTFHVG